MQVQTNSSRSFYEELARLLRFPEDWKTDQDETVKSQLLSQLVAFNLYEQCFDVTHNEVADQQLFDHEPGLFLRGFAMRQFVRSERQEIRLVDAWLIASILRTSIQVAVKVQKDNVQESVVIEFFNTDPDKYENFVLMTLKNYRGWIAESRSSQDFIMSDRLKNMSWA